MKSSRDSDQRMRHTKLRGTARYAEEEAVGKLLKDLAEGLGWSASVPFSCVKKLIGDLVFEIDVHKGPRNRDYELVEVQCECNIWHRKFGRTLSPNSLVGNIPLEPAGQRWILITQTGQLQDAEEALLALIREKVLPLWEDFSKDPTQAVMHLVERDQLQEYDIHLVLIELYAGEDYVLEVAQQYYDDLSTADKKRIQRHQGGETKIESAGNLLYIADQMHVRSGLLSWKKYDREGASSDIAEEQADQAPKPVRKKSYYTSREEQAYMRQIRRELELQTPKLAADYGFKSAGGKLQRREEINLFTLDIRFAEKGKTLTASLGAHPQVLDEVYWGMFDFKDIVGVPKGGYVITETKQLRDLPLEDARTEILGPQYVENALRALLNWAKSRVAFYEEQIDSVATFREATAGDATQRMNRILCDVYAKHYRDAMMAAQDLIRYGISGGVAMVISDEEQRDILEYTVQFCRKKLYG